MSGTNYNISSINKTFYNSKNIRLANGFARNPNRIYLEEYFDKLPAFELKKIHIPDNYHEGTNTGFEEEVILPRLSLDEGDIIHITYLAKAVSKSAGSNPFTLTINISNQDDQGVNTNDNVIFTTQTIDFDVNDTIFIDIYIFVTKNIIGRELTLSEDSFMELSAFGKFICSGSFSSGSSDPPNYNFNSIQGLLGFPIRITNDSNTRINIKGLFNSANSADKIDLISLVTEINGSRIDNINKNFNLIKNNVTNLRYSSDINVKGSEFNQERTGITLSPIGLSPQDDLILLPNDNSLWMSENWKTTKEIEFEFAFSIQGILDDPSIVGNNDVGNYEIGLITKDNINNLKNNPSMISNKISIFINKTSFYIDIKIEGKSSKAKFNNLADEDKIYKFRISIDNYRFLSIFLNGIQYNIINKNEDYTNNGVNPTIQLRETSDLNTTLNAYVPFVKIFSNGNGNNTRITKLFLYYMKISKIIK